MHDSTEANTGSAYALEGSFWDEFPGLLTRFVLFAPFLIGVIAVAIAIWAIVKWIRIKNKKTKGM